MPGVAHVNTFSSCYTFITEIFIKRVPEIKRSISAIAVFGDNGRLGFILIKIILIDQVDHPFQFDDINYYVQLL